MKNKNVIYGLAFAVGLFLMGGFTLDQRGFHSSLLGVIGSILLISAYLGFNWSKLKSGDHRTRVVTTWVVSLLILMVILDIIEVALS